MRIRHLAPLAGLLTLGVAWGCASSGPLAPTSPTTGPVADGIRPFGHYTLSINGDQASLDPVPSAQALGDAGAYDVTEYFTSAPCTDCVKLMAVSKTPTGKLALDIALRHPYRTNDSRLDLDAFDVRGILGVDGLFTFPATPGIGDEPLTTDPGRLLNADGYTTHFHERLTKTAATLNPFRRFFTEDDPSPTGIGEFNLFARMAMASDWDVQRFILEPPAGAVTYDFLIEASYGQPAEGPAKRPVNAPGGRMEPFYWNPEFNQKEAFHTGFVVNSTPGAAAGGFLNLSATIMDWQQGMYVDELYPNPDNFYGIKAKSDVGAIRIEIPGLGIVQDIPSSTTGTGAPDDPLQVQWAINLGPQTPGLYPALLSVTDDLQPEELQSSRDDLRAFAVALVRIQANPVEGEIPIALLQSQPTPASAALQYATFRFIGANSFDPGGDTLIAFDFDFDYDGSTFTVDYSAPEADLAAPEHTYSAEGSYTVALRVTNNKGESSDIVTLPVTVTPDPIIPSPSVSWDNGATLTGEYELNFIHGPSDSNIAIGPTGTIHVVWVNEEEGVFLGTEVTVRHVAIPPTGNPGTPTNIYQEMSLESVKPRSAVAINPANGTLYVVFALTDTIHYTQRAGAVWSEPLIAAAADAFGGETLGRFDLAIGPGHEVGLVYETRMPTNGLPARVYCTQRKGGVWNPEGNIGTGWGVSNETPGTLWPTINWSPEGFVIGWAGGPASDNLVPDVFVRRYNGTTWSGKETVSGVADQWEYEPQVAVASDGSVGVAYRTGSGVFGRISRPGQAFGSQLTLFANGSGRIHSTPAIVAGANGAFAVTALEVEGEGDPGTLVTLAFHRDHPNPSYFGLVTRGLAANLGPVYHNPDLVSNGQNQLAAVVESPQGGWNYIRVIRGNFIQP